MSSLAFPILGHDLGIADFENSGDVVYEYSLPWSCVDEFDCIECFPYLRPRWKGEAFLFFICADFDINGILSFVFGGSGSKSDVNSGDKRRIERIEIIGLTSLAFLYFEEAYIEPLGTLIVPILLRRLSGDWFLYTSVRLANLNPPTDCHGVHTRLSRADTLGILSKSRRTPP